MAWNPSPKVADCREIARKWGGKHQVIIIALDRAVGTIEMATYGQTKALCDDAKRMGDAAYQAVYDNYEDEMLPGARPRPANMVVSGDAKRRTPPPIGSTSKKEINDN